MFLIQFFTLLKLSKYQFLPLGLMEKLIERPADIGEMPESMILTFSSMSLLISGC